MERGRSKVIERNSFLLKQAPFQGFQAGTYRLYQEPNGAISIPHQVASRRSASKQEAAAPSQGHTPKARSRRDPADTYA